ncbi:MAG: alpha/beta fold hydrolase [Dehalococcoidia bacterium]|nr:alpha/beta fold hydrolase [Dehalococcoidia bacterium]
MAVEPKQRFLRSQRVQISYWDWGNEDAPPLVLVHGGRDHARSWERIAEAFRADYHVVAPDLRGHGDSEWTPGSAYGLPDNALDVVRVIEEIGAPARVLAHSYGGSVSLVAAGTYPEHFSALAVLEGTHSLNPEREDSMGPHWLRTWGDRVRGYEDSVPRVYPDLRAAEERMLEANPRLPADFVPSLAGYASKPVDGGYIWKYDFWVNGRTSMEIRREELPRFWEAVECPVLLVFARETRPNQRPDAEKFFRDARSVRIDDAGHWIHHDQPEALLAELRPFFAEAVRS